MRHFWQGFANKKASQVSFKKHVIMLFWEPSDSAQASDVLQEVKKQTVKYPTVVVKIINARKDPTKPAKHKIREFPTVLLLKDGREVDRVSNDKVSPTLIEQLFRKANV